MTTCWPLNAKHGTLIKSYGALSISKWKTKISNQIYRILGAQISRNHVNHLSACRWKLNGLIQDDWFWMDITRGEIIAQVPRWPKLSDRKLNNKQNGMEIEIRKPHLDVALLLIYSSVWSVLCRLSRVNLMHFCHSFGTDWRYRSPGDASTIRFKCQSPHRFDKNNSLYERSILQVANRRGEGGTRYKEAVEFCLNNQLGQFTIKYIDEIFHKANSLPPSLFAAETMQSFGMQFYSSVNHSKIHIDNTWFWNYMSIESWQG